MTKVKILDSTTAMYLEEEINEFIKDKEVINILYSTCHWRADTNTYDDIVFSVMILYKE